MTERIPCLATQLQHYFLWFPPLFCLQLLLEMSLQLLRVPVALDRKLLQYARYHFQIFIAELDRRRIFLDPRLSGCSRDGQNFTKAILPAMGNNPAKGHLTGRCILLLRDLLDFA